MTHVQVHIEVAQSAVGVRNVPGRCCVRSEREWVCAGKDILVRIANLLRVHTTRKEQDKGRNRHEEQPGGKVWVNSYFCPFCVDLREELVEDPFVGHAEEVGVQKNLGEEEDNDNKQLQEEYWIEDR